MTFRYSGKKKPPKMPIFVIYKKIPTQSKQSPNRRKFAQSGHPDPNRIKIVRTGYFYSGMNTTNKTFALNGGKGFEVDVVRPEALRCDVSFLIADFKVANSKSQILKLPIA
jgi:hypothetical protein